MVKSEMLQLFQLLMMMNTELFLRTTQWVAATFGYQISRIEEGTVSGTDQNTDAWGIAWNVNDNLSVSYGER